MTLSVPVTRYGQHEINTYDINECVFQASLHGGIVPGFDVFGIEDAQAVIRAGNRAKKPFLIMINRDAEKSMAIEHWGVLLNSLKKDAQVPMGIHLDHCSDIQIIQRACNSGFTSVMYDGSRLPLADNIRNTQKVCRYAHERGAAVEAELGTIPYIELGETNKRMTSPDEAEKMQNESEADFLAVSVGNIHRYTGSKVHIRQDVLHNIAKFCSLPLVIHGASGLFDEDISNLYDTPVGKLNFGTALRRAFGFELRRQMEENPGMYDRQALFAKPIELLEEVTYTILKKYC